MPNDKHTDVIVVGAGAAGLMVALKLAPLKVTIIAKAPVGLGSSSGWAQGGIAAAVGNNDSSSSHAQDTFATANGLGDEEVISLLTAEGPNGIDALIEMGMKFDLDADGTPFLGREAAHSHRRILHAQGDSTGKELMRTLGAAVQTASHICLRGDVSAHSLIVEDGYVVGVHAATGKQSVALTSAAVVLATGGIGALYKYTTNPPESSGDGMAMAARAGAVIADPEFVQFHPTAIDVGVSPLPLATEALRGEGAHLINGSGIRFMPAIHNDSELAPRDLVARAIWRQQKNGQKVFLDCRKAVGEAFATRFPTVFAHCHKHGIDPRQQPIPVTPAAHYHMGGVLVDINGRSSLPGLWACGEVAAAGIHGANRLASNSLLEAVVFAPRVAADILQNRPAHMARIYEREDQPPLQFSPYEEHISKQLRQTAYDSLGLIRDAQSIKTGLQTVLDIERHITDPSVKLINQLTILKVMAVSALNRRESRGGHFRADYPETREIFAKRTQTTLSEIDIQAAHICASNDQSRVKQA